MSESDTPEEDVVSFQEIYDFETRNLTGCDNDDSCCTFPKGYVYRQALYHCITCKDISGKQSGICYPCSVHCHSGHVLEDLYTKRYFRCDCGNSNFPSDFRCNLWEEKDDINIKNKYNHNFSGLYCVCNAEYDEGKDTEEMIQCIICEDWYHLKHLTDTESELKSIDLDSFEEFICKLCLKQYAYLQTYNDAKLNNVLVEYEDKESEKCNLLISKQSLANLEHSISAFTCGAFLASNWRHFLCRCVTCVTRMSGDSIAFLLDKKDSICDYYNNRNEDDLKEELAKMPHSQAIKIATGIATLKRHFTNFMNSMDPDKVITAEDVHNFFDEVKRRRFD